MSNLPVGTQNHPDAPWNQKEAETCPICQSDDFEIKPGRIKIKSNWYEYEEKDCRSCGYSDSNEPDPEDY
jgi:RNA polymerase subunit RPABC4/transcription elongation factor Spt4